MVYCLVMMSLQTVIALVSRVVNEINGLIISDTQV